MKRIVGKCLFQAESTKHHHWTAHMSANSRFQRANPKFCCATRLAGSPDRRKDNLDIVFLLSLHQIIYAFLGEPTYSHRCDPTRPMMPCRVATLTGEKNKSGWGTSARPGYRDSHRGDINRRDIEDGQRTEGRAKGSGNGRKASAKKRDSRSVLGPCREAARSPARTWRPLFFLVMHLPARAPSRAGNFRTDMGPQVAGPERQRPGPRRAGSWSTPPGRSVPR